MQTLLLATVPIVLVPLLFTTKGAYGSARTPQLQWASTLHQQLASLGRTLSLLRSTDVRSVTSAGTSGFARVSSPGGTFADSALGFFVDDCGEDLDFTGATDASLDSTSCCPQVAACCSSTRTHAPSPGSPE